MMDGIPYELWEWTSSTIPAVFAVGRYSEQTYDLQTGKQANDFTLTLETVGGSWLDLNAAKEKVMNRFKHHRAVLPDGSLVLMAYQSSMPIPSAAYNTKRLEIKIKITEWSVK